MGNIHNIGRPLHKPGFFEVTYRHDGMTKTCCLAANGFNDAGLRFDTLNVGERAFIKEITEERFNTWFDVSLRSAQNLAQLRTGAHL